MYESKSNRSESRLSAWIVVLMLGMVAVPATITLESVRSPAAIQMTNSDPTPYGYTWSLFLLLVPIVVIPFGFLLLAPSFHQVTTLHATHHPDGAANRNGS